MLSLDIKTKIHISFQMAFVNSSNISYRVLFEGQQKESPKIITKGNSGMQEMRITSSLHLIICTLSYNVRG